MDNGAFDRLDNAILNYDKLVEDLNYRAYSHNRRISPDIKPSQWGNVFPNWSELEDRFIQEGS